MKKCYIKKKEEEDVFKMKLNLDQKDSKNGEIILLLNQLAGVANRVKRLKEKRKKDNKDDSILYHDHDTDDNIELVNKGSYDNNSDNEEQNDTLAMHMIMDQNKHQMQ